MTVKELKEFLADLDDDVPVCYVRSVFDNPHDDAWKLVDAYFIDGHGSRVTTAAYLTGA